MVKAYGGEAWSLKKATLPASVLTSIGRLVRAIASIDDILTLHIAQLAGIREGAIVRLLGRSAFSTKLATALYFAKLRGKDHANLHAELFNSAFDEYVDCRNAVAHGTLVGKTEEGRYAFVIYSPLDPKGDKFTTEVVTYSPEDLEIFAREAQDFAWAAAKVLGVEALQKKRLQQTLLPHRKSGQQSQAPQTRPGSSQAKPHKPSARQRRDARIEAAQKK
jgi:hypothetical protein